MFENQSKFIKWSTPDEIPFIYTKFEVNSRFIGIVDIINGTHIKVHPKAIDQRKYRNYKKFHSIVLMGIVFPDKNSNTPLCDSRAAIAIFTFLKVPNYTKN